MFCCIAGSKICCQIKAKKPKKTKKVKSLLFNLTYAPRRHALCELMCCAFAQD